MDSPTILPPRQRSPSDIIRSGKRISAGIVNPRRPSPTRVAKATKRGPLSRLGELLRGYIAIGRGAEEDDVAMPGLTGESVRNSQSAPVHYALATISAAASESGTQTVTRDVDGRPIKRVRFNETVRVVAGAPAPQPNQQPSMTPRGSCLKPEHDSPTADEREALSVAREALGDEHFRVYCRLRRTQGFTLFALLWCLQNFDLEAVKQELRRLDNINMQ